MLEATLTNFHDRLDQASLINRIADRKEQDPLSLESLTQQQDELKTLFGEDDPRELGRQLALEIDSEPNPFLTKKAGEELEYLDAQYSLQTLVQYIDELCFLGEKMAMKNFMDLEELEIHQRLMEVMDPVFQMLDSVFEHGNGRMSKLRVYEFLRGRDYIADTFVGLEDASINQEDSTIDDFLTAQDCTPIHCCNPKGLVTLTKRISKEVMETAVLLLKAKLNPVDLLMQFHNGMRTIADFDSSGTIDDIWNLRSRGNDSDLLNEEYELAEAIATYISAAVGLNSLSADPDFQLLEGLSVKDILGD